MMDTPSVSELLGCASRVTAAYISNNKTTIEEIPSVVTRIFQAFSEIFRNPHSYKTGLSLAPAVPIEESIHEDYIVCLEDGKKLQMLKRHLNSMYGMSLDQYKERWGLPIDYPAVAPSYARRRSAIAKSIGLGKTGRKPRIRVMQGSETATGQEQVAVLAR
ncbi:MAG: MucR family transcriptional regulator [Pseudomonadota bacterium]|nr:MucR family transcriptional regulator [Alphaproteobacteria bacterium]MDP5012083.1 MucR family transcriptional regulator [Alphaproteobacteria bacterium]MDP5370293.1 MucR family transcriptional regulator [Pseudomonadota bacterium]